MIGGLGARRRAFGLATSSLERIMNFKVRRAGLADVDEIAAARLDFHSFDRRSVLRRGNRERLGRSGEGRTSR